MKWWMIVLLAGTVLVSGCSSETYWRCEHCHEHMTEDATVCPNEKCTQEFSIIEDTDPSRAHEKPFSLFDHWLTYVIAVIGLISFWYHMVD